MGAGQVHAFVVRPKALGAQQRPDAAITKARMLARQLVHARHQMALIIINPRRIPLRRPRLTSDFASPSLRYLKAALKHVDRLASARRAYQFPFAISL